MRVHRSYALTALPVLLLANAWNCIAQSPSEFTVRVREGSGNAEKIFVKAYRSDGSFALKPLVPKHGNRKVVLTTEAKEIDISDSLGLKTTYDHSSTARPDLAQLPKPAVTEHCAPSVGPNSPAWKFIGEEKLLDLTAYHFQAPVRALAAGSSEHKDIWYAPALNCYPLRVISKMIEANNSVSVFESVVTEYQLGPPDAALFNVSPASREVLPSELERSAMLADLGDRLSPEALRTYDVPAGVRIRWDRLDQKYKSLNDAAAARKQ